jgi:hypothetical protein
MPSEKTPRTPAVTSKTQSVVPTPGRSGPQPLSENQLRQVGGGVAVPTAPNKTW